MTSKTHYITFYSYKGGVGRTTAAVNLAYALARAGRSVFLWELDLEAPSLLEMPTFATLRREATGGVVDILANPNYDDLQGQLTPLVLEQQEEGYTFRILPAGLPGPAYATTYGKVDFHQLFQTEKGSELFELLRQEIERTYNPDFVIIDSRTGLTDIGAIATIQMADTVILVTTLSEQSLAGTQAVQIQLQNADESGIRREPLKTYTLASHVPQTDTDLVNAARRRAESLGIQTKYEIPLDASLFVRHRIAAREAKENTAEYQAFRKLALDLIQDRDARTQPLRSESIIEGKSSSEARLTVEESFANRLTDLFRLMGFLPISDETVERSGDLLFDEPGRFRSERYLVHPAETLKDATPENLDLFRRRAAKANLRGIFVTQSPNTLESSDTVAVESYPTLLDRLVDFADSNDKLIANVRGTEIETRYVELNSEDESKQREALTAAADAFVRDESSTLLLLLGDFGTGKTWFTKRYAAILAERHQQDPRHNRRPIRIDLREVAKELSLESILRFAFPKADSEAILYMLREGRLVLLFDGFDEMATQADFAVTRENFRQLARAAAGKAKVILTCRTHYFKEKSEETEALRTTPLFDEARKVSGFRLRYLPVFTPEQTEEFIHKALGPEAENALTLLRSNESLRQISTTPVLLDMVVRTVDRLKNIEGEINLAELYQQYTDEWLSRNDWRLRLTKDIRDALLEELAWRLWSKDTAEIHYSELQEAIAPILIGRVEDLRNFELAGSEVRTATFLIRDNVGNYRFAHRSFLEFFLARRIAANPNPDALAARRLSPPVLRFLVELLGRDPSAALAKAILEKPYRKQASENALLLGAAAGVPGFPGMKLSGADLAGWNGSAFNLEDVDLSQSNLREANLSAAVLANANLESADLAGANLEAAHWQGARLKGADLRFARAIGATGSPRLEGANTFGCAFQMDSKPQIHLPPSSSSCWSVALHPNGHLGAAAIGSSIAIFDIVLGEWRRLLSGHLAGVTSVAFSPNSNLLASASGDKTIRLWDPASGKLLRSLSGHDDWVTSVAFSPNSNLLASASKDKTIRLWDPAAGKLLRSLSGHNSSVYSVAFSPNSNLLASASGDKTIRLWDPQTGRCLSISRAWDNDKFLTHSEDEDRNLVHFTTSDSAKPDLKFIAPPSWALFTYEDVKHLESSSPSFLTPSDLRY
jgi:uncharacterized protein YjbI with pentapeptide repeats/MinD-like ATPase involved in chromosome partitioning or flagellar assembly